jgi:predicted amidophosphoribosyltransferase
VKLANCPRCGSLFQRMALDICPDCVKKREEDFTKVKKLLADEPTADLPRISEVTELDEERILEFVHLGWLLPGAPGLKPTCRLCGEPAAYGELCGLCRRELRDTSGRLGLFEKMHTINRRRDEQS